MKNVKHILIILVIVTFALMQISCNFFNEENEKISNEKITLEIWHIWTTDVDANKKTFEAAVDRLEEKYPHINFVVVGTETETYKTRIKTSVAVNDAPDIFFTWGAGFSEPFVEADKILNLDEYYNDTIKKRLPEETLRYQTYNGSLYGLPFMQAYALLYVNEEMVNSYGYTLPLTYDDLLSLSDELIADNIVPIAISGSDKWAMMFHYASLCLREVGPEKVQKTIEGELSFKQQGFIDAGYKLQEMVGKGVFGDEFLNAGYEEAADLLYKGEAAMFYMANWASGGFTSEQFVSDKATVMPYFLLEGEHDNAMLGGTVDCFMINKDTKYPDLAFDVVVTIAETMSEYGSQNGMGSPAWDAGNFVMSRGEDQSYEDFVVMDRLYNKTSEVVGQMDGSVIWWDVLLGPKGGTCNQMIVDLATGKLSPMEFAESMDELVNEGK